MSARSFCAALALTAAVGAGACGSPPADPTALLHQAKMLVDAAHSVHFQLTSSGAQGSGPVITGGSGDLVRPDSFRGLLNVTLSGFAVDVNVVSTGGSFLVKLPTDTSYLSANPADYGFADPAQLLDPQHGVSGLLLLCQSTTLSSDDRYNGEELHEVGCMLPGNAVATLLTSADPSQSVAATFGVTTTNELRKVVLNGPFYSASKHSTFTLVIDKYGEHVSITAPPSPG
jgi:lipoprotein LprG